MMSFKNLRHRHWILILMITIVSLLRSGSIFNYSMWIIDEQFIVSFSLGFLGFDFNPKWFVYHTLPMYLLSIIYFLIYTVFLIFGLVSNKVEFSSLLFSNHALFFTSARFLFSLTHTAGCFVLSWIIYRYYKSFYGALLFFAAAILIPDSIVAANMVRVDSFVFFFLTLTVYYSCYAEKRTLHFFGSLLACSAAFASKFPAIVLFPILFVKCFYDIYKGEYPKKNLVYFFLIPPLAVFCFMPYSVLDFTSYKTVLEKILINATGGYDQHIGKLFYSTQLDKIKAVYTYIIKNTGFISFWGTLFAGFYGLLKDKKLFFTLLFVLGYTTAFTTSSIIDEYWLRPVYPFFIFLTIVLLLQVPFIPTIANWIKSALKKHQNLVTFTSILKLVLILLTVYYGFLFHNSAYKYYQMFTDHRIDNRILASNWIYENISENSIIILDTLLSTYSPKIFSRNYNVTLASFDYPLVWKNEYLSKGFEFYFNQNKGTKKNFTTILLFSLRANFSLKTIPFPMGSFIVISSYAYGRYYQDFVLKQTPELTQKARKYYDFIKQQSLVKEFVGKGPKISIYKINLPIPKK